MFTGKIKVIRNELPVDHFSCKIDIVDTVFTDTKSSSYGKQIKLAEYKHAFILYSSIDRDGVLRRV